MDPLETETARFWENHGELQRRRPVPDPDRGHPAAQHLLAEDEGSLINSSRWLQWHWPGGSPPGEAKVDTWIMAPDLESAEGAVREGRRAAARPILNLRWPYADPDDPKADEIAREINGYAIENGAGSDRCHQGAVEKGKQVAGFAQSARRWRDGQRMLDLCRLLQRERATTWPAGIPATPTMPASIRTGHSPGRPTAASCTTVPRPT